MAMLEMSVFAQWRTFIEKLPMAALVYDQQTLRILSVNRSFIQLLGYPQTAFNNMTEFLTTACPDADHRQRLMNGWMDQLGSAETYGEVPGEIDAILLTRGRHERHVRLQMVEEPSEHFAVVFIVDMTAVREMSAEMHLATTTDYLTGLPNRKQFNATLTHQLEHSRRYREDLSMLMMNLDNFSAVNDQFGCDAGDRVILATAEIIQSSIRACDFLSRISGETYCVLMPSTDEMGAMAMAERIRKTISDMELVLEEGLVKLTISIGIVHAYKGLVPRDQMMMRAEAALKEAKASGKDRIVSRAGQMIL